MRWILYLVGVLLFVYVAYFFVRCWVNSVLDIVNVVFYLWGKGRWERKAPKTVPKTGLGDRIVEIKERLNFYGFKAVGNLYCVGAITALVALALTPFSNNISGLICGLAINAVLCCAPLAMTASPIETRLESLRYGERDSAEERKAKARKKRLIAEYVVQLTESIGTMIIAPQAVIIQTRLTMLIVAGDPFGTLGMLAALVPLCLIVVPKFSLSRIYDVVSLIDRAIGRRR